jgi:hypothetical protein
MNKTFEIWKLNLGIIGLNKIYSFGQKLSLIEREMKVKFDDMIRCKIHGFLIKIYEKYILADTGLHLEMIRNPAEALDDKTYTDFPLFCDDSNFILNEIKKHGLSADNIDYLLISHSHYDHIGAIECFSGSKIIINERFGVNTPEKRTKHPKILINEDAELLVNQDLYNRLDKSLIVVSDSDKLYDLFNDGSFIIINTKGHSSDHLSAILFSYRNDSKSKFNNEMYDLIMKLDESEIVRNPIIQELRDNIVKSALIPFDVVFSQTHYKYDAISKESAWDYELAMKSLILIKKIAIAVNCKIYFSHDHHDLPF